MITLLDASCGYRWQLYRIWYESERVRESLGYQTPPQRLSVVSRTQDSQLKVCTWHGGTDEHHPESVSGSGCGLHRA